MHLSPMLWFVLQPSPALFNECYKNKMFIFHYSRMENVKNETTKTPCHKKIKIKKIMLCPRSFLHSKSESSYHWAIRSSQKAWTFQARHLKVVAVIKKKLNSQAQWHTSIIPALGKQRQEGQEFKVILGNVANSGLHETLSQFIHTQKY